jgi:hypothetical protein
MNEQKITTTFLDDGGEGDSYSLFVPVGPAGGASMGGGTGRKGPGEGGQTKKDRARGNSTCALCTGLTLIRLISTTTLMNH